MHALSAATSSSSSSAAPASSSSANENLTTTAAASSSSADVNYIHSSATIFQEVEGKRKGSRPAPLLRPGDENQAMLREEGQAAAPAEQPLPVDHSEPVLQSPPVAATAVEHLDKAPAEGEAAAPSVVKNMMSKQGNNSYSSSSVISKVEEVEQVSSVLSAPSSFLQQQPQSSTISGTEAAPATAASPSADEEHQLDDDSDDQTEVSKLLRTIGLELKKPMDKFAAVLAENWIETLEDLQEVPDEQLKEWKFPFKLVQKIKQGLKKGAGAGARPGSSCTTTTGATSAETTVVAALLGPSTAALQSSGMTTSNASAPLQQNIHQQELAAQQTIVLNDKQQEEMQVALLKRELQHRELLAFEQQGVASMHDKDSSFSCQQLNNQTAEFSTMSISSGPLTACSEPTTSGTGNMIQQQMINNMATTTSKPNHLRDLHSTNLRLPGENTSTRTTSSDVVIQPTTSESKLDSIGLSNNSNSAGPPSHFLQPTATAHEQQEPLVETGPHYPHFAHEIESCFPELQGSNRAANIVPSIIEDLSRFITEEVQHELADHPLITTGPDGTTTSTAQDVQLEFEINPMGDDRVVTIESHIEQTPRTSILDKPYSGNREKIIPEADDVCLLPDEFGSCTARDQHLLPGSSCTNTSSNYSCDAQHQLRLPTSTSSAVFVNPAAHQQMHGFSSTSHGTTTARGRTAAGGAANGTTTSSTSGVHLPLQIQNLLNNPIHHHQNGGPPLRSCNGGGMNTNSSSKRGQHPSSSKHGKNNYAVLPGSLYNQQQGAVRVASASNSGRNTHKSSAAGSTGNNSRKNSAQSHAVVFGAGGNGAAAAAHGTSFIPAAGAGAAGAAHGGGFMPANAAGYNMLGGGNNNYPPAGSFHRPTGEQLRNQARQEQLRAFERLEKEKELREKEQAAERERQASCALAAEKEHQQHQSGATRAVGLAHSNRHADLHAPQGSGNKKTNKSSLKQKKSTTPGGAAGQAQPAATTTRTSLGEKAKNARKVAQNIRGRRSAQDIAAGRGGVQNVNKQQGVATGLSSSKNKKAGSTGLSSGGLSALLLHLSRLTGWPVKNT
ncbi:unnamed protein product [Amoebophrya sp. A120]|nr:unnamed protein product [Amoebophrya sp. A120]|eukprot:GSA120T00015995001.1